MMLISYSSFPTIRQDGSPFIEKELPDLPPGMPVPA